MKALDLLIDQWVGHRQSIRGEVYPIRDWNRIVGVIEG